MSSYFLDPNRTVRTPVGNEVMPATSKNLSDKDLQAYKDQMELIATAYNSNSNPHNIDTALDKLKELARAGKLTYQMCQTLDDMVRARQAITDSGATFTVAKFKEEFGKKLTADYIETPNGKNTLTADREKSDFVLDTWMTKKGTELADKIFAVKGTETVSTRIDYNNQGLATQLFDFMSLGNSVLVNQLGNLKESLSVGQQVTDKLSQIDDIFNLRTAPTLGGYRSDGVAYVPMGELIGKTHTGIVNTPQAQTEYNKYLTDGKSRYEALALVLLNNPAIESPRGITWEPFGSGTGYMTNNDKLGLYTAVFGDTEGKRKNGASESFIYDKLTDPQKTKAVEYMIQYMKDKGQVSKGGIGASDSLLKDGVALDSVGKLDPTISDDVLTSEKKNKLKELRGELETIYNAMTSPPESDKAAYSGSLREKLRDLLAEKIDGVDNPKMIPKYAYQMKEWFIDKDRVNQKSISYAMTAALALNDKNKQEISAQLSQYQQWTQMVFSALQVLQQMSRTVLGHVKG